MKNMFDPVTADEVKVRIAQLRPHSERQWGTMTPAQMVAHCSAGLEMALGDVNPPRVLIGRIIGRFIKSKALGNDEPFRRNSPTSKALIVSDNRDLETERERLLGLIDRFVGAEAAGCTKHPHPFFGPMTPGEWAELKYKHLDHHLRQFGV